MTKDQLQKELLEKVKPGTKPSHLKKLKRSKSEGDIPKAPPLPTSTPLSKSQSNPPLNDPKYPYTTLISQQEELDRLQKETTAKSDTIKLLRQKIESLEKEGVHSELSQKNNPPIQLLQDQLSEKQKQIEDLRKQLETQSTVALDNSLLARHKSLKDWFTQYQKTKQLDTELSENIEEASEELISQDQTISTLRTQISQLKLTNQSLTKDLNLATKLAELRKDYPNANANHDYLKYGLYALATITFIWLLSKTN